MLSSHEESIVLPFETLTDSSYSTLFQVQKISNLSVGVDGSIEKGQKNKLKRLKLFLLCRMALKFRQLLKSHAILA